MPEEIIESEGSRCTRKGGREAGNRSQQAAHDPFAPKRIAVRLGLAFSLMGVLLIVVGDLGLRRMDEINTDLQNIVGNQWKKLRLAQNAVTISGRNSRITLQIFLLSDRLAVDALLAERAENSQHISTLLAQLQTLCVSQEEKRRLSAVEDARRVYVDSYQRALHLLVQEKKHDEALVIMIQKTSPALVKYHAAWDSFAQLLGAQLELAAQESSMRYVSARHRVLWIIAIAVMVTGTLALFVIRRILQELTIRFLGDKAELSMAHQEAEVFIDAVPSILVGLDNTGRITRWNAAAERNFELSESEVAGKRLTECGIRWVRPGMEEEVQSWLVGPSRRCDQVPFEGRGGTRLLGLTTTPLHESHDNHTRVLVIGSDTTERTKLEGQLHQAQKLEAVGQLAAGIAHEINTPTQYIGDNVRFLKDAFHDLKGLLENYQRLSVAGDGKSLPVEAVREIADAVKRADPSFLLEEIPKAIEQTLEGVTRVSTLVSAMKEFSHPGTKEKIPLDLNHAIDCTITVARNEWKYVAEMETEFDLTLPLISCLPGEFNQVILILIVNAAHAIGDVAEKGGSKRGTIKIQTRNCAEWAEVRVQDTGSGIPENVRSRIFDPFFTTKQIGKGTGQGLAIARSVVVDKHLGTIHFETELGKGTTFILRLPKEGKAIAARA